MAEFNPYQPPSADVAQFDSAMDDLDGDGVVPPPTGWAWAAMVMIGVVAALALAMLAWAWSYSGLWELIARRDVYLWQLQEAGWRRELVWTGKALALLSAVVCFAVWVAGANRTARSHAPDAVRDTPGWAVGWYFVPLANLYRPFQGMREIWLATRTHLDADRDGRTPRVFTLWWVLWLVHGFVGGLAYPLVFFSRRVLPSHYFLMVSEVLMIAAAIAAIRVVRAVSVAQEEAVRAARGESTRLSMHVPLRVEPTTP